MFTELCRPQHNLILEYLYHPNEALYSLAIIPYFPFLQLQATINYTSIGLALLDISQEWNHTQKMVFCIWFLLNIMFPLNPWLVYINYFLIFTEQYCFGYTTFICYGNLVISTFGGGAILNNCYEYFPSSLYVDVFVHLR